MNAIADKKEQEDQEIIEKRSLLKNRKWIIIVLIVAAVLLFACYQLVIIIGVSGFRENYSKAYDAQKNATYQEKYNTYKSSAEKIYHVSNRVSVYLGDLKEEEKLKVLHVSDIEYVIEDKDDNADNIISWLEVPGEGDFVVDLKAGEYIIDEERAHVLVRIPEPELENVAIDYRNVEKLLFKNDVWNESYKIGEDLARRQLVEAELLIKKEFSSNQNYYKNAEKAAKSTIETLIKQLNANVDNLTVDVEVIHTKE